MILIDSSVWIDYFNGASTPQTDTLDRVLSLEELAIGDLILTEVLQGFAEDRAFGSAKKLLTSLSLVEIGGREIAIPAAANFRALRKRGVTVRKTIHTLIATRCILDRYHLLYSDRDFDPFVRYLGLRPAR